MRARPFPQGDSTAGASLSFDVVADVQAFEGLAREWDALARAVVRPTPFHLRAWLANRWRHLGLDAHVLLARRDGVVRAALPLAIAGSGTRSAGFLAGPYAGLDLMLHRDEPLFTAQALLAHLERVPCDCLEIFGLPRDSVFAAASASDGVRFVRLDGAPRLELADDWDAAYRRRTSSKTRGLHRRRLRQLEEQGPVELVVAEQPSELEEALEESFRLHDLRWRRRRDPDLSHYSEHQSFHRAAARALGELGVARIALLRLDGRAIAFHYYFVFEKTMFVHRLAFDPAYERWSPGQLVTLYAIEQAAAAGCARVDFLRGEERYKLQLADHVEDVLWTACFPQTARGRVAAWRRMGELRLRQRAKSARRLHAAYQTLVKARGRLRRR